MKMYIHMVQVEYEVFLNIPLQERLELTVILIILFFLE